jgi:hypothetical protein
MEGLSGCMTKEHWWTALHRTLRNIDDDSPTWRHADDFTNWIKSHRGCEVVLFFDEADVLTVVPMEVKNDFLGALRALKTNRVLNKTSNPVQVHITYYCWPHNF